LANAVHMNSCLVEGVITSDLQYEVVDDGPYKGKERCYFIITSNKFTRTPSGIVKESSDFGVNSWDKVAKYCHKNGRKGREVRITGSLKQVKWGKDDQKYSAVIIEADQIDFRP